MPCYKRCFWLLILPLPVLANAGALRDHDNSPLSGIFGLPDATEGAILPGPDASAWSLVLEWTSHAVAERTGVETFIADGETSRVTLEWERGFGSRWSAGVEIPLLTHQAGSLDSFIDDWHKLFGFPDGARDRRPRDLLEFSYSVDDTTALEFRDATVGLGDVRFFGGFSLGDAPDHRRALRLGLKLPTGSSRELLGSGAIDVSLGVAGDRLRLAGRDSLSFFYRANAVYLGGGRYLPERQKSFVVTGAAGLSFAPVERLSLTVQAALRGPLYDSRIEMLGQTAVALTVGGRLALSDRLTLSLGLGEDIRVGSTPDVTFRAVLSYAP